MLSLLRIQNVAVIERAEIEFGAGLNVMTGETGAGKSIVIDSLCAVLGRRASRELIRTGAESASVTAVFTGRDYSRWLDDNGAEPDEDGQLIITRKMSREGKSLCRVNGTPVSAAQLRELGDSLINIHGQNDAGRLLDEAYHLEYLDGFGGLEKEAAKYRAVYDGYCALLREMEKLSMDEDEKARRVDSLRFQISELEGAELRKGEMAELSERRELQKNAGKLTESLGAAFSDLYGGDEGGGALALLADAELRVSRASAYSGDLAELAGRLRSLRAETDDVAEQLREIRAALDFSPEDFERLEERLDKLRRLSRKYGADEDAMLAFLAAKKEELDIIEYSSDRLEKLRGELEGQKKRCLASARELYEKRLAASKALRERIASELAQLNMPGVRFEVEFSEKTSGFDGDGAHDVRFLMSANAGEAMGRLSRIASGGELARIILAMKNVLAAGEDIPTLVFDEIDTGVSGVAAQRVGEKLSDLARERQVLCVTHLPQIAAMGDRHFRIEKDEEGGRTFTRVTPLDGKERERELARLYGGENISDITLSAAGEQLTAAERYKKRA